MIKNFVGVLFTCYAFAGCSGTYVRYSDAEFKSPNKLEQQEECRRNPKVADMLKTPIDTSLADCEKEFGKPSDELKSYENSWLNYLLIPYHLCDDLLYYYIYDEDHRHIHSVVTFEFNKDLKLKGLNLYVRNSGG